MLFGVLLSTALIIGCGRASEPPRGVVLVVIDTLRADRLGVYGYTRPTSPRIDALSGDAVLFRQATSPAPWTLPSLATLMTSLYPSVHGAHSPSDLKDLDWYFKPHAYQPFSSLHESRTTLAEILQAAGFATFGAVQGSYPTSAFGMSQGFDVYHENATPGLRFDLEDSFAWLDTERPERFLVYLHTVEVHAPYTPPEIKPGLPFKADPERLRYFEKAIAEERRRFQQNDFDPEYSGSVDGSRRSIRSLTQSGARRRSRDVRHLSALYDQGIAYVDYWVGELVDGLERRGLLDETVVVITSDHGEEFFEHGRLEHSYSYYEEMLRVPLVVRVPGEARGMVVDATVGLIDVMPTLLDVLEVPVPAGLQGHSLRGLWRGESRGEELVEYIGEASRRRGDVSLRGPDFKYIRAGRAVNGARREELYDLRVDPGERTNRCRSDRAACARLREKLAARMKSLRARASELAAPEAAEIDAETLEGLKALGYLDPEIDPEPEARADPE